MKKLWNRCDNCGKFVGFDDLGNGSAQRKLIYPLSEFTSETYETICKQCLAEEKNKMDTITMNEEADSGFEEMSIIGYVGEELQYMINILQELKGEDRSKFARYLAIFITDLEKLYAFHQTYLRE